MLRKSSISIFLVLILALSIVTPAFAEDSSSERGGLVRNIQNFFSRMFERNGNRSEVRGKASDDQATGSGEVEKDRLKGQVKAGKITDAQKQAILAEVQKIRDEIKSWSSSNGVSSSYIYRGLVGEGMMGKDDDDSKTATSSDVDQNRRGMMFPPRRSGK